MPDRYLGNTHRKEVHDLTNEKAECRIDEVIRAGRDRPFDSLAEAHEEAYQNCYYCLGRPDLAKWFTDGKGVAGR